MAERGQQYKDGDPTTTRGPCRCGYRHWFQGQEYDLVGTLPIETDSPSEVATRFSSIIQPPEGIQHARSFIFEKIMELVQLLSLNNSNSSSSSPLPKSHSSSNNNKLTQSTPTGRPKKDPLVALIDSVAQSTGNSTKPQHLESRENLAHTFVTLINKNDSVKAAELAKQHIADQSLWDLVRAEQLALMNNAVVTENKRLVLVLHYVGMLPVGKIRHKAQQVFGDILNEKSQAKIHNMIFSSGMVDYQGGKYNGALLFGSVKHGHGKWANGEYYRNGNWVNDEFESGKCKIDLRGNIYDGELEGFVPHGKASIKYGNGDVFKGAFDKGVRCCETGEMKYSNGDLYRGGWQQNLRHGEGTLVQRNGDFELGEWREDKLWNGTTKKTLHNSAVFEGSVTNGERVGEGTMRYADGSVYRGTFKNGKRSGTGTWNKMSSANGASSASSNGALPKGEAPSNPILGGSDSGLLPDLSFEDFTGDAEEYARGTWENDEFVEGTIKKVLPNGDVYEGKWLDNKMHGQGKLVSASTRDTYHGEFDQGLKHGNGVESYWNGMGQYEGPFQRGTRHGVGIFTWPDGHQDLWSYVNGKKVAERPKPADYAANSTVASALLQYRNEIEHLTYVLENNKTQATILRAEVDKLVKVYAEYDEVGERILELEGIIEELKEEREEAKEVMADNIALEHENQRLNQQLLTIAKETSEKLANLKEQVFQMAREEYQQSIRALKTEFEREVTERIDREVDGALAEKNAQLSRYIAERDELAAMVKLERESKLSLQTDVDEMKSNLGLLQESVERISRDYNHLQGLALDGLTLDQVSAILQQIKKAKKLLVEHKEKILHMKLREQENKLKQIEEDQLERKMCVICMERKRETLCEPCGHVATCNSCAEKVWIQKGSDGKPAPKCPVCVQRINRRPRQVFFP